MAVSWASFFLTGLVILTVEAVYFTGTSGDFVAMFTAFGKSVSAPAPVSPPENCGGR